MSSDTKTICQVCGGKCKLPIDFHAYIRDFYKKGCGTVLLPPIEIENGMFRTLVNFENTIYRGISSIYTLMTSSLNRFVLSPFEFVGSVARIIQLYTELYCQWFRAVATWSRYHILNRTKCFSYESFLNVVVDYLLEEQSKLHETVQKLLTDKSSEIEHRTYSLLSDLIDNWFRQKITCNPVQLFDSNRDKPYLDHAGLCSIMSTSLYHLVDILIGATASFNLVVDNRKMIYYNRGYAAAFVDDYDVLRRVVDLCYPHVVTAMRVVDQDVLGVAIVNMEKSGVTLNLI